MGGLGEVARHQAAGRDDERGDDACGSPVIPDRRAGPIAFARSDHSLAAIAFASSAPSPSRPALQPMPSPLPSSSLGMM